jgi:hypothetical protein
MSGSLTHTARGYVAHILGIAAAQGSEASRTWGRLGPGTGTARGEALLLGLDRRRGGGRLHYRSRR